MSEVSASSPRNLIITGSYPRDMLVMRWDFNCSSSKRYRSLMRPRRVFKWSRSLNQRSGSFSVSVSLQSASFSDNAGKFSSASVERYFSFRTSQAHEQGHQQIFQSRHKPFLRKTKTGKCSLRFEIGTYESPWGARTRPDYLRGCT